MTQVISPAKQANQSLDELEGPLELFFGSSHHRLLEALPVGVYACDRDGVIVRYNRKAAELWGQAPRAGDRNARLCGAYKAYLPSGEVLTPALAPMQEVLGSGNPVRDRELVLERRDGSRIIVLANVEPLFDGTGRLVGAVNCFQDITPLKRVQDEVREHDRRLGTLLDALPVAVYTTDAAGAITFYNEAAAQLWGWRPELGSNWCGSWRLRHPDGRPMPHDECPMARAVKDNRIVTGEAIAERPDGTLIPFLAFPTPLHDEKGAFTGAVNTLVDISQLKRAEQTRQVLIGELNHRVKNTLAT